MSEPSTNTLESTGGRRYELQRLLGSGGFGEVWAGRMHGRSGFSKLVAVKVLKAEGAEIAELEMRLRDEARMLGFLRHRAIVHVEDLVRINGAWAVVMEYIDGCDLKDLMREGPMSPRAVCEVATEVAAALRVAHEATDPENGRPLGIVHRDIKPGNIRVSSKGEVKVLDFGIARAEFDRREAHTRSLTFGSPGYLAPERMDLLDSPAGDIYALGIVVVEALVGSRLGQLSVSPRNHDKAVQEYLGTMRRRVGTTLGGPLCDVVAPMLRYEASERPTAHQIEEAMQDLVPLAQGAWLKRLAADSQKRRTADGDAPTPGGSTPGSSPPVTPAPSAPEPVVSVATLAGSLPVNPDPSVAPTERHVPSLASSALIPVDPAPPLTGQSVATPQPPPMNRALALVLGLAMMGLGAFAMIQGAERLKPEPATPATVEPPAPIPTDPEPVEPEAPPVVAPPPDPETPKTKQPNLKDSKRIEATAGVVEPPSPPTVLRTGAVTVKGGMRVELLGADGKTYKPGELSPGTYKVVAYTAEGRPVSFSFPVNVQAGGSLTIACDTNSEQCRIAP